MPIALRIALIIGAVALVLLVIGGVRKSRMRIEDSLFWIVLSLLVLVLSIFPYIGYWASDLLDFQSPISFIMLFFIAVLMAKCFSLARQVSQLENKMKELTQRVAVDRLDHYERSGAGLGAESDLEKQPADAVEAASAETESEA